MRRAELCPSRQRRRPPTQVPLPLVSPTPARAPTHSERQPGAASIRVPARRRPRPTYWRHRRRRRRVRSREPSGAGVALWSWRSRSSPARVPARGGARPRGRGSNHPPARRVSRRCCGRGRPLLRSSRSPTTAAGACHGDRDTAGPAPGGPRAPAAGTLGLARVGWIVAQFVVGGSSDAEVGTLFTWVYGWVGLAIVSALIGAGLGVARPLRDAPRHGGLAAATAGHRRLAARRVPGAPGVLARGRRLRALRVARARLPGR